MHPLPTLHLAVLMDLYKHGLSTIVDDTRTVHSGQRGSVGRAVASDTRGPRFKSSHRQKIIYMLNYCLLSTVY